MTDGRDLDRALRALPERAPPPEVTERVRRRARALFVRRASSRGDRVVGALDRVYGRVEAALAVGVSVVYLSWAVQAVLSLR